MKNLLRGLLAATVLIAFSCQVPISPRSSLASFRLVSSSPQLKASDGRTTLPTAPAFTYTVELVGATTLTFSNLTALTEAFEAPVGDYTLQVTMYNDAVQVIGLSAEIPITVGTNTAANVFNVTVVPQTSGTGSIAMSYSWPATGDDGTVLVDAAVFELRDLGNGGGAVDLSGLEVVNVAGQNASVVGNFPSGTYLLTLRLSKTVNGQPYYHPTVSDVVRVYDNLESSRDFPLTSADLQSRPSAPGLVNASYNGTSFAITWAADVGTQMGFNVYRNGTLVATESSEVGSFTLTSLPHVYSETFEVATYNAFGESPRVAAPPVAIDQLLPTTGYNLAVGYSTTTDVDKTTLHLSWSNPGGDTVSLYRATSLAGPYSLLMGSTATSYVDNQSTGLVPGTTYHYAIATQGGYQLNLPTTTIVSPSSPAFNVVHTNPVPGVVSGTTLAWDMASQTGVPVVGSPYLAPDTNQLPDAANWSDTELPGFAVLAGGYTYWVWGTRPDNFTQFLIGAFDSSGVLQETYVGTARFMTAFEMVGTNIVLTHQLYGVNQTQTIIPWSEVDWFQPADYAINIDFQIPTAPVITFEAGGEVSGVILDGSYGIYETLQVDTNLVALGGYSLIDWTIDGLSNYPNEAPFSVNGKGVLTIESQHLEPGVHEVLLRITDGTHIYSANFNVTVVRVDVSS